MSVVSFPEAVDGRLVELRRELIREAQARLEEFERGRDDETRGRFLEALDVLALLVRVG